MFLEFKKIASSLELIISIITPLINIDFTILFFTKSLANVLPAQCKEPQIGFLSLIVFNSE